MAKPYGIQAALDEEAQVRSRRTARLVQVEVTAPDWAPEDIWPKLYLFGLSPDAHDRLVAEKLIVLATDPRMEAIWARLAGHEEKIGAFAMGVALFAVDGAGTHGLKPADADARCDRVVAAASELLRALAHAPNLDIPSEPVRLILEAAFRTPSPDDEFGRRDRGGRSGEFGHQDVRAFVTAVGGTLMREFGIEHCAPLVVDLAGVVLPEPPDLRVVQLALGRMRKK